MIDTSAEILSGQSMGNLCMGRNVADYPVFRDPQWVRSRSVSDPQMTGRVLHYYSLGDSLYVTTEEDGVICAIGCNERYRGRYRGVLYPGISMGELVSLTSSQRILNCTLIVNEDYGLSFTLPYPYDEIADELKDIPLDTRLNEIYVEDYSFWAPKKK
ncbi:MAG: hypothetical protein ABN482_05800 [Corticimicrobacter sp.]|uniref:hypothetical protein n=1 Tax=Corticimicrobacter sp. TaxID=2678536 RepID=UPI0032DA53A3